MAENRVDLYASPLVTGAPTVGQPVGSQYQWQRAEIVRHLGASQYLVRMRYNNSIVNARIGWLDERIAKLTPEVDGRRQYLAAWLAVVRYYEQQVRNDLKLLVAVDSREFRAQRTLVEEAEKAFRIGIPYSYAEFQGKRNEVGDLGDELIWAAEDAAELIPNDEGIRDIPLAAIEAFHTTLDNLTSASCWEFVPGDPCQDGGGGGDPIDESPFISGIGSGWPEESPPTVEESGESGDGSGGGNRKAEAIAAARDLLAAFPTVEQCLERLRVSQKDLATAGAWYAAAKADLAVWVFDLTEAQGEKKLLADKGVLADAEIPVWTTVYNDTIQAGTKVWLTWPAGDPRAYAPIIDYSLAAPDEMEPCYEFGQPQTPMSLGVAGSALAFAMFPAWQRYGGTLGYVGDSTRDLIFPATVLSVDDGIGSVRMHSVTSSANLDIVVQHPQQIDGLSMSAGGAIDWHAWLPGDTAAVRRRYDHVTKSVSYDVRGWMHHPKYYGGTWTLPTRPYFTSEGLSVRYWWYHQYPNGLHPLGHPANVQIYIYDDSPNNILPNESDPWDDYLGNGYRSATKQLLTLGSLTEVDDDLPNPEPPEYDSHSVQPYMHVFNIHGGRMDLLSIRVKTGAIVRAVGVPHPSGFGPGDTEGWASFGGHVDASFVVYEMRRIFPPQFTSYFDPVWALLQTPEYVHCVIASTYLFWAYSAVPYAYAGPYVMVGRSTARRLPE